MSLTGEKLGPYEIIAPIGKGGMGEVYRARDPRLGREVAIKVSTEKFSERFQREARVIASLNHPNICALYDVGPNYLVMELIEGESPRGPLPLETALDYARQIASALEAAHEKGITHRDLKPGNIKVTPSGIVKVLDFGLAKVGGGPTAVSEDSPTMSISETQAGIILGTAAYMSPEQAKGQRVDKRTDIWAFGVVLYEMLMGKRPFDGDTLQETMASVLKEEIKLDRVPAKARPLLEACLQKDPKQRLHDIADAKLLLSRDEDVKPVRAASSKLPWLAAAVAIIAAAGVGWLHFREAPPVAQSTRFQIEPPAKTTFGIYVSVAPDGRKLAFTAASMDGRVHLWVRDIDALQARELPGTEIRSGFGSPFWSPDSKFVGFSDANRLLKVDASGVSLPQVIAQVPNGAIGQGSWSDAGIIIFGGRGGGALRQVSDSGGEAKPLTTLDTSRQENGHGFPFFLPDGKHFLYTRGSRQADHQGIFIGSLDAKPEQQSLERLIRTTFEAVYAPTKDGGGRIMYLEDDGALMAQPFDASKLALAGPATRIAERVGFNNAYGFFSVSAAGVLAYRGAARPRDSQPTWFDRQGDEIRPDGDSFQAGVVGGPVRLSPDGTRLAETRLENRNTDVWIWEFTRGIGTRLTFNLGNDQDPVWSPDGTQIAFVSDRDNSRGIFVKPANGASEEQSLIAQPGAIPESWSSDGKYLLYSAADERTRRDIWVLPLQGDRKPAVFLQTPFGEYYPRFSPDARWVAYVSNESGRAEVYVLPFAPPGSAPVQGGKWQVSKDGGEVPVWTKNGSELIYISQDGSVMAVDVTTGNAFHAGVPQKLFKAPSANSIDVTSDGQKFLFTVPAGDNTPSPITVVTNWGAGLKK